MMRFLINLILVLGIAADFGLAYGKEKQVIFQKEKNTASVTGTVVRGERDKLTIRAKGGQELSITVTSLEKNAIFQIYVPGYSVKQINGTEEIAGKTLPQAGDEDDAVVWHGTLPISGKYLIVVGSTRGNAEYKMVVTITGIATSIENSSGKVLAECQLDGNQIQMNYCAGERFERADAEMNELYQKQISRLSEPSRTQLQESQDAWNQYLDKACLYEAGPNVGSMWPMTNFLCKVALIEQRTNLLKEYLACTQGGCPD